MKMNKIFWILLFIILPLFAYSVDWANNDIAKFTPDNIRQKKLLIDTNNIEINPVYITKIENSSLSPHSITNDGLIFEMTASERSWLTTQTIKVGDDFLLSDLFINLDSDNPESYVIIQIRDDSTQEILAEHLFYETGNLNLVNFFQKEIYLSVEIIGEGIKIYSFGLERIEENILDENDIVISVQSIYENSIATPDIYYYGRDLLNIDFNLQVPSTLDVIVFNPLGEIIDYISKDYYFSEGAQTIYWNAMESDLANELISGQYIIYFSINSVDGKTIQINKTFTLANN